MGTLVPETLTRLQARAFVCDAELHAIGREQIIRTRAEHMAEQALRKILADCVKTEEYMRYSGQMLHLDVYVVAPDELYKMLAEARMQGECDARYWATGSQTVKEK